VDALFSQPSTGGLLQFLQVRIPRAMLVVHRTMNEIVLRTARPGCSKRLLLMTYCLGSV
jgi:hypothetical protein